MDMNMNVNMNMKMIKDNPAGYEDLRGAVINWGYEDFEDFNVGIYNHKAKWQGQKSYFMGISQELDVIISKITNNIYFLTWGTDAGRDDIVLNFDARRVNATSATGKNIMNVHGEIYEYNSVDAKFPHGDLTAGDKIMELVAKNISDNDLTPMDKALPQELAEDDLARIELANKYIVCDCDVMQCKINIDHMHVHENGKKYPLFSLSNIDKDIYFMTWYGATGKCSIVINAKTKMMYMHMLKSDICRQCECEFDFVDKI